MKSFIIGVAVLLGVSTVSAKMISDKWYVTTPTEKIACNSEVSAQRLFKSFIATGCMDVEMTHLTVETLVAK